MLARLLLLHEVFPDAMQGHDNRMPKMYRLKVPCRMHVGGCPTFLHLELGASAVLARSLRARSLAQNNVEMADFAMKPKWSGWPATNHFLNVAASLPHIQGARMGYRMLTAMRACAKLVRIHRVV